MTNRKVIILVEESGAVKVTFEGEHISRRELLRAQRAMGIEWRERVRQWRRQNLTDRLKSEAEKKLSNSGETDNVRK